MSLATRPSWIPSTILSFFIFFPNAAGAKHQGAQEHSTVGVAPNANVAINLHGLVNTNHFHNCLEYTKRSGSVSKQGGYIVWWFFAYGVLCIVLVIWCVRRYSQERLGIDDSTRLLGRVPGIAAGRELKLPDLKVEEATPINPGSIAPPQIKRGKQFATPAIWDVKEPYSASNERQIWMTSLVIGDWTQKNVDQDPEGSNPSLDFPTVHYPVRASVPPRANLRNRGVSDASMLKGVRRIPYPCIINPNLRRPHRGLSPKIIESCCQENHSLKISLYGNPRLLLPDFVAWFILIIAVNDELQDPEHDLNFWKKILNDPGLKSEAIYFASIAGDEATPKRIHEGIAQLFHDSEALGVSGHANLFVYLTGKGDNQNRMCLPDEKYLAKEEIKKWVCELRATWGYIRPITLVLDICQPNGDDSEQGADSYRGIELISSCSARQYAQAIEFSFDQDMPYSCFFLAVVVASLDSPSGTAVSFKADIERHLSQIVGLINARKILERSSKGVGFQEPDWSQAGDISTFFELARMLSRTKLAREAREFVVRCFPAEYTMASGTAKYEPLPEDHTTRHLRGPEHASKSSLERYYGSVAIDSALPHDRYRGFIRRS